MLKKIILFKLKFLTKLILKKYHPKIIGITGSVGKTSAREAVFVALSSKFNVRRSLKNYNNELGLPLSVIGAETPGKNIFGWLAIFFQAGKLIFFTDKNFPDILILEMGVDKVGDMDYLNSITGCDVGVITTIGATHLESFGSVEKIQKEKEKLLENLNKNGWAILNFDDEKTKALVRDSEMRVMTYGFKDGAEVRASNLLFKFKESKSLDNLLGLTFKVSYKGSMVPVILPKVAGTAVVYAALAAVAVGLSFGLNLVEIAAALKIFDSPRGRMKLIPGIKHSLIIDDTYNSSPQSSIAAIDFISQIETDKPFRKVAVLGDMLELGAYSEEGHHAVGRSIADAKFALVVTVGERSRDIDRGAKEAGLKEEQIFHFPYNLEAGKFVQDRIKEGDLLLIKGSQGARMEEIVKELMAEPLKAEELLVRQGKEWSR